MWLIVLTNLFAHRVNVFPVHENHYRLFQSCLGENPSLSEKKQTSHFA